jgi:type I restriction enzyme S subunit
MPRRTSSAKSLKGRNSAARGTAPGSLANDAPSPEGAEQGELPERWAHLTVGEVASNSYASRAMETPSSAGIPFIPMALLPQDGSATTQWELRKPEEVRSGVQFTDGDVLLAKITPCLENGKLGIARGVPGGWGMTSTEVYPLRPVKVTAEFLAAFLAQPAIRHALASKMQGATGRQRLPREALDSFPITVPPLPEQQAIAEALRTVQRAKEGTEKVIAATRQLKASLMKHLFTYGPVPLDKADQAPLTETEIGPINARWKLATCESICDGITVGLVVRPASHYVESGVPAFRSLNVREDRLVAQDLVFFSEEANKRQLSKSRLRAGDVLIIRTGYPGTSCVVPEEYDGANCIDLVIARPKLDLLSSEYLSRFFNSAAGRQQAVSAKVGLAQQHLNVGAVKRTLVPLPPVAQQREIVASLAAVDAKLIAEEWRREALGGLFKSLLHHLMTGRIRLPEFA